MPALLARDFPLQPGRVIRSRPCFHFSWPDLFASPVPGSGFPTLVLDLTQCMTHFTTAIGALCLICVRGFNLPVWLARSSFVATAPA
jgi:hypothetical protein